MFYIWHDWPSLDTQQICVLFYQKLSYYHIIACHKKIKVFSSAHISVDKSGTEQDFSDYLLVLLSDNTGLGVEMFRVTAKYIWEI